MKAEVVEWPPTDHNRPDSSTGFRAVKVTNDNADVVWYNYKTYVELFGDPRLG